jgi:hypothetical protein
MGFKVFGINIDIPFLPTAKGVVKGIGHLFRGEFSDALKAVGKGLSQDTLGMVAATILTGGLAAPVFGSATVLGMNAVGWGIAGGSLGLGVADAMGHLDTRDEKWAKMQQQQLNQASTQGGGRPYQPQFSMNWGTV